MIYDIFMFIVFKNVLCNIEIYILNLYYINKMYYVIINEIIKIGNHKFNNIDIFIFIELTIKMIDTILITEYF